MKAIALALSVILVGLVEADLNQPLVPFTFLLLVLLLVLQLVLLALEHRRNP